MLREPAIDRARLLVTIRDDYGIDVDDLEFVPIGYVAACYAVLRRGQPVYFLKLWPDTATGRASAAQVGRSLPLLRSLSVHLTTARVPQPLETTTAELWSTFDDAPYALFPFFAGSSPNGEPGTLAGHWDDVAVVLAELHSATAKLADQAPHADDYEIPFEDVLRGALATVATMDTGHSSERALNHHVLSRRDEIMDQLDRLHRLRREAQAAPAPLVLCHTDLGCDNVLIDDEGLVVLDWDEAALAPAEHDLKIAIFETDSRRFLRTYLAAGGITDLRPERFAFYLLRRHLEDMATHLLRVLHDNPAPTETSRTLDGMFRWGFDRCARLDQSVATFEEVVASSA